MEGLTHNPERPKKVASSQEINPIEPYRQQEYTNEIIPLKDRSKDGYLQKFVKDTQQISKELTTLGETIPRDLPQLELDEEIQKRIDNYENKQKEQKLFPASKIEEEPPIFWKIMACENRIKYGEKRINRLANHNKSSKDLAGSSEDWLNLYRYLQEEHYQSFEEDCKDLKGFCIYLLQKHGEGLNKNYKHIVDNPNKQEGELGYPVDVLKQQTNLSTNESISTTYCSYTEQEGIEKEYLDLKEQYKIVQQLKEGYDRLEVLSKESHDKHEGPHSEQSGHDKDLLKPREILRDLEICYQHQYQDPYKNLEEHLKGFKQRLKNLEARRYTYLGKNLQDLQKVSSYLIEHCEKGLGDQNRKYLEKTLKKLQEQWKDLEKPGQNLEQLCKILAEGWKDFAESSKIYLLDIKLLHENMKIQEKELAGILDVYNDKKKNLTKLKRNFEDKQKEFHTSIEGSPKPETSSYQDDSHSVSTAFENLHIDNLTGNIDQLEKLIDEKKAIIHQNLKKLAFQLRGNLFYFLDEQKHETDFYLKNPNLQHLPAGYVGCGIACTMMVVDLLKSWKNTETLLQKFAEVDPKVFREDIQGSTATYTYPIVLKKIGHHINYEYAKVPDIAEEKYETPRINAKWDEKYRLKMGKDPKEITVDDFKNAIGQKDKAGNVIPVIASITMDFHTKCHHAIVLDGWAKTPEGEELLVVRDIHTEISPETGKPLTNNQGRLWKDFLEVWTGVAIIPSDPN